MKQKESLSGQVVVITGASSGFGKGAALAFGKEGARLALAARRGQLLAQLVSAIQDSGQQAFAVPTDVSHLREMEDLARRTVERYGRIDVWINDAGVGAIGPFEKVPMADHVKVIETNLLGTLYGTWFAYKQFLAQGSGILINVSSELGRHTVPYYASYAAAKHGIVGLDDALQQEVVQQGHADIHVCTVLPTAHDTPFFDHAANYTGHETKAPQPLHDPHDVVETILRLARDPRDTEIVGGDGVVKVLLKSLAPGLAKKLGARQMHKTQMESAPPAAAKPGAVRVPMQEGTGISGGRRQRT